ncbi:glycine receptor subunit alpha-2-like [Pollicipes pollicipes]|uniref:glycine receptor subunit alpha-2-like n=1 Tax=Pollicipes pollicipes TaxID=41117 RepID=UPI0018850286|nr:glycine receptor subunit alpha-2-like [Pollicipes pollicipes]
MSDDIVVMLWPATAAAAANDTDCAPPSAARLIPADYDRLQAPFSAGRPLTVHLSVWVSAVTSVNELQQEFSVALYLRLKWRDHRVTFPRCRREAFVLIEAAALDRLWLPDIYFGGEKRAARHAVVRRNAALRLNRIDSSLYLSERLSLAIMCSYDFQLFPMDLQVCMMNMEPYAHDKQFIDLSFEQPGIYFNNFKFRIPQFRLTRVVPGNCSYTYIYQGTTLRQSCVRAAFFFERTFNYYLLQIYVPSVLIVIISFLGFFVPVNLVPGRIALSITTLLTLATQSQALQKSLPPVSYMKASDVWMFACILSVFATLLEFTLSYRHYERRQRAAARVGPVECATRLGSSGGRHLCMRRRFLLAARSPHFVDSMAKVIFPAAFTLFNVVYWLYFLDMRERRHRYDTRHYIA